MKSLAQISQRARWSRHHQGFDPAIMHELLHRSGDLIRETMLFEFVPVGSLHAAAGIRARTLERATRAVGALLAGSWIFVGKDVLYFEVGKFFIPGIPQKEGLFPISNKNKG